MNTYTFARSRGKWELKRAGQFDPIRSGDNQSEVYTQAITYVRIHGGTLKIHGYDGELKDELNFSKRNAPPKLM
ncbi:MAG: hypothetical protein KKA84_12510 [Bacteroidetes bacterium]|nr:hypothetical protein [Bacteroidota bacterium]